MPFESLESVLVPKAQFRNTDFGIQNDLNYSTVNSRRNRNGHLQTTKLQTRLLRPRPQNKVQLEDAGHFIHRLRVCVQKRGFEKN